MSLDRLLQLPRKMAGHLRLLRDDPERFGRNLLQFTNPAKFEATLLDVLAQLPLRVRVGAAAGGPALNLLQPELGPAAMTGGPNTALVLAALIAEQGVPVRVVTRGAEASGDPAWFEAHMASLLGRPRPALLGVARYDAAGETEVGADDIWMATHWTTAQALKPVLPRMRRGWFVYLIQDFEPGFYAWSSNYALALETYSMPYRAVINCRPLAAHFAAERVGRFAEPGFYERDCVVFDPAVDRRVFHLPTAPRREGKRRLLFYARPTNPRNMLGLGMMALRRAIAEGAFPGDWEFLAIGGRGSTPDFDLGQGLTLRPAPWKSYAGYGDDLRAADILLCPMLSPHTSYPVLEMAACGGFAVTTAFGTKTPEALAAISPRIRGVAATTEALAQELATVAAMAVTGAPPAPEPALPPDWDAALRDPAAWVARLVRQPDGAG